MWDMNFPPFVSSAVLIHWGNGHCQNEKQTWQYPLIFSQMFSFCTVIRYEEQISAKKLWYIIHSTIAEYLYGQCVSIEDFIKEWKWSATTRLNSNT